MTRDEFYARRDSRSTLYLAAALDPQPVQVIWGKDAASTGAGQLLLLGTANQLARFVRVAGFRGPDAALHWPTLSPAKTLRDGVLRTAEAIDPFGEWEEAVSNPCYTIGIGNVATPCDLYVSAQEWVAYAATDATQLPRVSCPLGAALAACIAVANAFKVSLQLDQPLFRGSMSLWNYKRDRSAVTGPPIPSPLRVGNVLVVGAGAVASSLTYWLSGHVIEAKWDVVDPDHVDLTSTNRGLLFTAQDAGFDDGVQAPKAAIIARYLGRATPHIVWYDDFKSEQRWDLYLPLANARGARRLLQAEYPPIMLHATTSPNWESQLHRHRPERDRCLPCRLPEAAPVPECSRSTIAASSATEPIDAALPFLSAAAGAMLAADIVRLAANEMNRANGNFIRIDWHGDSSGEMVRSERCDRGCPSWGSRDLRAKLNNATRWFSLDVTEQSLLQ